MKILFAAWRYHPNYDGMIAGLTRAGHSVAFLAHFTHPTEKYADGVELCIVERSAHDSSESLRGRRPQWHRRIAPSFTFLYNYLRTNRPDLVIARDYSRTNYTIFLICQLLGIKYLHYTQMRPGYEPVSGLTYTQTPPRSGINSLQDSILVKRAWAEYTTPVGQLRFGRMPDHWGLGIYRNAGDDFDGDFQTHVDRIAFFTAIPALDLHIGAAWDFANELPTSEPWTPYGGPEKPDYAIYRATGYGNYVLIHTLQDTTWADTTVRCGTEYSYRIIATGSERSVQSNVVTLTAFDSIPPPPPDLLVATVSSTEPGHNTMTFTGMTDRNRNPTNDLRLEVSLGDRELRVFRAGEEIRRYDIAVGQPDHPTPTGDFTIHQVDWNPDWTPPDSEWAEDREHKAPGQEGNPMGRVRLVYRAPYTIHGTEDLESLGGAESHGSIRMANEDIIEHATLVMEAGGETRSDAWYEEVLANPTEMVSVELANPVRLVNTEGAEGGSLE
jgi:hypothetical protein